MADPDLITVSIKDLKPITYNQTQLDLTVGFDLQSLPLTPGQSWTGMVVDFSDLTSGQSQPVLEVEIYQPLVSGFYSGTTMSSVKLTNLNTGKEYHFHDIPTWNFEFRMQWSAADNKLSVFVESNGYWPVFTETMEPNLVPDSIIYGLLGGQGIVAESQQLIFIPYFHSHLGAE